MEQLDLLNKSQLKATAILLGERIDLRTLELVDRLAINPTTVNIQNGGIAVVFRYGAVVLFGVGSLEQAAFLAQIQPLVKNPFTEPESESIEIVVKPDVQEGIKGSILLLNECTLQSLQLVADSLAKSVILAQYESKVSQSFDRIEPLAVNLGKTSFIGGYTTDILKQIGDNLLIAQTMVGRVEVGDKPELLWEHPELERLYTRLVEEFEIRERHLVLERKLELISRTAQTALNLLQHQRSLRVEWYIVILIVLEIFISLYELFFAHP